MNKSKKIKIAYFFPIFRYASMARWVENFYFNHDKEIYEVMFVAGKIEESFKTELSKKIFVSELDSFFIPGLFFKLVKYFKQHKPDIFISAFPHINTIVVLAKIISNTKVKIVLTEHTTYSFFPIIARSFFRRFVAKFILPLFMKILYPFSDVIVCVSKGVAKDLSLIINCKAKIKVIYNPIVNNKISDMSKEKVNDIYFLDPNIPVVLAVGRLVKQKDYPTLIQAMKLVVEKRPAYLVILGEGEAKNKLESLILKLKISKNVVFLGFQKNPYKYMKNASVFVLSSLSEGFGNVIAEAMACGTPVVATDCKSGPNEIIENGKSGILVPVGDFKSLSDAIIRILDNEALRQKFSEQGLKRSKYFSSGKSIMEYEKIYKKLMEKNYV